MPIAPNYSSRVPWRAELIESLYVVGDYPMPEPAPVVPAPVVHEWAYRTLAAAKRALSDALDDAAGDYPDMEADDYAHDLVSSVALDCAPKVALEFCRTELGWVPADVRRMRPDVAKITPRALVS